MPVRSAPLEAVTAWLDQRVPQSEPELRYAAPWQLAVATILSAQCTDARVNQVTPALFARYPGPEAMAAADPLELEALIRPTGFFRAKSRHLIGCARRVVSEHGGRLPDSMDALLQLPGIGRKTANVILGNAFGRPAVIVDTHVRRVSRRLGLSRSNDPARIERELAGRFPPGEWTRRSQQLLLHGRYVCLARKPRCAECGLRNVCPWHRTCAAGQGKRGKR
ncbi:MAG: endonuclease III [Nitrospirae bacterium]|nr:endonuclease III [Nitrospirota bacterium]